MTFKSLVARIIRATRSAWYNARTMYRPRCQPRGPSKNWCSEGIAHYDQFNEIYGNVRLRIVGRPRAYKKWV